MHADLDDVSDEKEGPRRERTYIRLPYQASFASSLRACAEMCTLFHRGRVDAGGGVSRVFFKDGARGSLHFVVANAINASLSSDCRTRQARETLAGTKEILAETRGNITSVLSTRRRGYSDIFPSTSPASVSHRLPLILELSRSSIYNMKYIGVKSSTI